MGGKLTSLNWLIGASEAPPSVEKVVYTSMSQLLAGSLRRSYQTMETVP